jgi:hypothetical protein
MATCPNCGGAMSVTAAVCPHCSYDFPLQKSDKPEPRGIAYSALADLSLVVGMACAALGAIAMLVAIGAALLESKYQQALVAVLLFFLLLALYVVFVRVADME